ncbi:MAG: hypothetical protein QY329_12745 [Anaerolineales bacterium]|nr:MAG: hypothetical protein QY329_12745 [Anaerolineales bacterium]
MNPPKIKIIYIVISVIVLCFSLGAGVFAFALFGGGGESANLGVTTRVSQEFVGHVHNGQIELAHSMLSEKFSPPITKEQFEELIRQDERIFKTYQNLEICDWGFFISDGRVIDASGLLYYEDGVIAFQISLHKDSDTVWRVQGFRFRSDVEPKPFGLCE